MYILTPILMFIFLLTWIADFKRSLYDPKRTIPFHKTYKFKETIYFFTVTILPLLFVNFSSKGGSWVMTEGWLFFFSVFFAFLISFVWYLYLDRIDLFEKEPKWTIILTFILGAAFAFLVFPISGFIQNDIGFRINGEAWNDFWYCVFTIGMVEEIVKIIPFFIILKFTKQVNEPFDYIFYASISALGFAFSENTIYLERSHLSAVNARALMASVGHMFDSSVIAYGLIYFKHKKIDLKGFEFPIVLFLASLVHGFYDFWLISDSVNGFYYITIFFFLFTLYLWQRMANNLLNISPYYSLQKKLDPEKLKYRIINIMVTLIALSYLVYYLFYGQKIANRLLIGSWSLYAFLLLYLAMSLSSFELMRFHIGNIKFKNSFAFLFPNIYQDKNYVDTKVRLYIPNDPRFLKGDPSIRSYFPMTGTFIRRISYQGNTNCYLFQTEQHFDLPFYQTQYFVVKLISREEEMITDGGRYMLFYGIKKMTAIDKGVIPDSQIVLLQSVVGVYA